MKKEGGAGVHVQGYREPMLTGSWVLEMGYTSAFVILVVCFVTDTFGRSGKNKGSN